MLAQFGVVSSSRPPYTYNVETSGGGFRVTADTSAPGAPPHLWVDDSMVVQSSN